MIRFLLCLTVAAAACLCASALAANRPSQPLDTPLLADLDADGTDETVRARETACFNAEGTSDPPCSRFDKANDRYRTYRTKLVRLRRSPG